MTHVNDFDTAIHPTTQHADKPQFNSRESAMICQYERLRAEWNQQLDLLECSEYSDRPRLLIAAETLDRQLSEMEWKLPDAYTCLADIAPPSEPTSIATAFARLLKCHGVPPELRNTMYEPAQSKKANS